MKKLIRLLGLLTTLAAIGDFARAETPAAPTVTVGGLVDTYYTYNFTNSSNNASGSGNNGTLFNSADDSYSLALAETAFTVTQGQASGKVVLAYGQEGSLGLLGSGIDVLQAYVSYNPDQWSFKLGRMATHMGNEVIESNVNWNYSRSLLFWYPIPLWHTGLSVTYTPDATLSIMACAHNGWNSTTASHYGKSYGLQVMIKPEAAFSVILNGIIGPDPSTLTGDTRYVGEGIITWAASDKFSLVLDAEGGAQNVGTTGSASFWGVALYGRYQIESDWAATLRLEELKDNMNLMGLYAATPIGAATDVEGREATLTIDHNFTPNLLGRLEGRMDMALSGGTQYSKTTTTPGPFAGGEGAQTTASASMALSF
jgi:hypothetical protein